MEYKKEKENFVSNLNGTDIWEILIVSMIWVGGLASSHSLHHIIDIVKNMNTFPKIAYESYSKRQKVYYYTLL